MWNYQITTYQMFSVLFPFSWYRYSIHYATFHVIDFGIIGDFNIAWPTIFHIHLQNHLLYLSSENGSMCSHKATLTRCEYNANWLNNLFFFLNEILHHMYITTATYKHFLACMWFSLQTHLLSVAAVINNILYCMYNHYSFPSLVNWLQLAMAFCFCWWFLVLLLLLSSPLLSAFLPRHLSETFPIWIQGRDYMANLTWFSHWRRLDSIPLFFALLFYWSEKQIRYKQSFLWWNILSLFCAIL